MFEGTTCGLIKSQTLTFPYSFEFWIYLGEESIGQQCTGGGCPYIQSRALFQRILTPDLIEFHIASDNTLAALITDETNSFNYATLKVESGWNMIAFSFSRNALDLRVDGFVANKVITAGLRQRWTVTHVLTDGQAVTTNIGCKEFTAGQYTYALSGTLSSLKITDTMHTLTTFQALFSSTCTFPCSVCLTASTCPTIDVALANKKLLQLEFDFSAVPTDKVLDQSGNNNNFLLTNDYTIDPLALNINGLYFDSTKALGSETQIQLINQLTFSFWVRFTGAQINPPEIFQMFDIADNIIYFHVSLDLDDQLHIKSRGFLYSVPAYDILNIDKWHFIAIYIKPVTNSLTRICVMISEISVHCDLRSFRLPDKEEAVMVMSTIGQYLVGLLKKIELYTFAIEEFFDSTIDYPITDSGTGLCTVPAGQAMCDVCDLDNPDGANPGKYKCWNFCDLNTHGDSCTLCQDNLCQYCMGSGDSNCLQCYNSACPKDPTTPGSCLSLGKCGCTQLDYTNPGFGQICVNCDVSCLTCDGDNENNCLTCDLTQYNQETLSDGTYCRDICGDTNDLHQYQCEDDNLINGDGCDDQCNVEPGYFCSNGLSKAENGGVTGVKDTCVERCGDGLNLGAHQCDDANVFDGDGCDQFCVPELGYACTQEDPYIPTVCKENCGDGVRLSQNECDDGNSFNGDGCDSNCFIQDGFECVGGSGTTPDTCTEVCGDGLVFGNYACDDGNLYNYDGCNSQCQEEPGYLCMHGNYTFHDICVENCGDGYNMGQLACDDGNNDDKDGCSATCSVEIGWTCTSNPYTAGHQAYYELYEDDGFGNQVLMNPIPPAKDTCQEICGDGVSASGLECDDGNLNNLDGCSDVCTVEPGYECTGGSFVRPDSCVPKENPFVLEYYNSGENKLYIKFNDTMLVEDFSNEIFEITINGPLYSYTVQWEISAHSPVQALVHMPIVKHQASEFTITTTITEEIFGDENLVFTLLDSDKCRNVYNIPTVNQTLSVPMTAQPNISSTLKQELFDHANSLYLTAFAFIAIGLFIPSFQIKPYPKKQTDDLQDLKKNENQYRIDNNVVWNFIITLQFFHYYMLLSIYQPYQAQILETSLKLSCLEMPGISQSIGGIITDEATLKSSFPIPNYRFPLQGVSSIAFLLNGFDIPFWLFVSVILAVLSYFLYRKNKLVGTKSGFIIRAIDRAIRWQLLFRLIVLFSFRAMIMALVNFRKIDMQQLPTLIIGFVTFAFIMLTAFCLVKRPVRKFKDARKQFENGEFLSLKDSVEFTYTHGSSFLIFMNSMKPYNYSSRIYYLIFFTRAFAVSVAITGIMNAPEYQGLTLMGFNGLSCAYIMTCRPFIGKLENLQAIINEMCILTSSFFIPTFIKESQPNQFDLFGYYMKDIMTICMISNIVIIFVNKTIMILRVLKHKGKPTKLYSWIHFLDESDPITTVAPKPNIHQFPLPSDLPYTSNLQTKQSLTKKQKKKTLQKLNSTYMPDSSLIGFQSKAFDSNLSNNDTNLNDSSQKQSVNANSPKEVFLNDTPPQQSLRESSLQESVMNSYDYQQKVETNRSKHTSEEDLGYEAEDTDLEQQNSKPVQSEFEGRLSSQPSQIESSQRSQIESAQRSQIESSQRSNQQSYLPTEEALDQLNESSSDESGTRSNYQSSRIDHGVDEIGQNDTSLKPSSEREYHQDPGGHGLKTNESIEENIWDKAVKY